MVFIRTVEDFTCEHCGHHVEGNGYTNHCPHCLYSKHVDNEPGDRAATCGGMMPPTHVEYEKREWILTHTCERCRHTKRNKMTREDRMDVAVTLIEKKEKKTP
jgi:Zn finger protein HypA/HybF involved in hydrogenase expression